MNILVSFLVLMGHVTLNRHMLCYSSLVNNKSTNHSLEPIPQEDEKAFDNTVGYD